MDVSLSPRGRAVAGSRIKSGMTDLVYFNRNLLLYRDKNPTLTIRRPKGFTGKNMADQEDVKAVLAGDKDLAQRDLRDHDFSGIDLSGADLTGAHIERSIFAKANLLGLFCQNRSAVQG